MNHPHTLLTLVAIVLGTAGCATTRVVKTQPGRGGEIAVHDGLIGDARGDAKKLMKQNCGRKKFEIVEEGEAVIGSTSNGDSKNTKWGAITTSSTRNETEWRLAYKCRS